MADGYPGRSAASLTEIPANSEFDFLDIFKTDVKRIPGLES